MHRGTLRFWSPALARELVTRSLCDRDSIVGEHARRASKCGARGGWRAVVGYATESRLACDGCTTMVSGLPPGFVDRHSPVFGASSRPAGRTGELRAIGVRQVTCRSASAAISIDQIVRRPYRTLDGSATRWRSATLPHNAARAERE